MTVQRRSSDKQMHATIIETKDGDDELVDFANASLYLSAIQTILSVLACAATSILACWLLPESMVSAVRTLTLTCLVAAACMHKPLHLGQVHGLKLVFSALRPAVIVYIGCLTIETLLHTCTRESDDVPSWRKVVFQSAVIGMMVSGIMRAKQPLATTDLPFLLTVACLLLVAALPPPAVSMQGPLCQSVSVPAAAERMVRAFVFGCVYSLFVYLSAPGNSHHGGIMVCIMRASAASVWVLGASFPLLLFALPQGGIAIYSRLGVSDDAVEARPFFKEATSRQANGISYAAVATRTPPPEPDCDYGLENGHHTPLRFNGTSSPSHHGTHLLQEHSLSAESTNPPASQPSLTRSTHALGPLSFRQVTAGSTTASKERMRQIADEMTNEVSMQ